MQLQKIVKTDNHMNFEIPLKICIAFYICSSYCFANPALNIYKNWIQLKGYPLYIEYRISLEELNKSNILNIIRKEDTNFSKEVTNSIPIRQKKCDATYASMGKEYILHLKREIPLNVNREREIFYYSDSQKDLCFFKNFKYLSIRPSSYALDEPLWIHYLYNFPIFAELNTWINIENVLFKSRIEHTILNNEDVYVLKGIRKRSTNQDIFNCYTITIFQNKIKKITYHQTVEKNNKVIYELPIECEVNYSNYFTLDHYNTPIPKTITINRFFIHETRDKNNKFIFKAIPASKEIVQIINYSSDLNVIKNKFKINIPKGTRISDSLMNKSFTVGDYIERLENNLQLKK